MPREDVDRVRDAEVRRVLRQADDCRNKTAALAHDYNQLARQKRALTHSAAELQTQVDQFVRHSAEETHKLQFGLAAMKKGVRQLAAETDDLEGACDEMETVCRNAERIRDQLKEQLARTRADTAATAERMHEYIARTRENMAPLQRQLANAADELAALEEMRMSLARGPATATAPAVIQQGTPQRHVAHSYAW